MLHLDSNKMYTLVLIKESENILKLEVLNSIHKADDLTGQVVIFSLNPRVGAGVGVG